MMLKGLTALVLILSIHAKHYLIKTEGTQFFYKDCLTCVYFSEGSPPRDYGFVRVPPPFGGAPPRSGPRWDYSRRPWPSPPGSPPCPPWRCPG